jgi:hypothetical protein
MRMKIARLFVLATIALAGCTPAEESGDKHLISKEVYTVELGPASVYGVRMHLTTDKAVEELGASVRLSSEKTSWTDTLYLELRNTDTLETEAIFNEALTQEHPNVRAQIEFFPL